jgi:hypothetical protein
MNQNTCENLTVAVKELRTLDKRISFALQNFEPASGLIASDDAMKILKVYTFKGFFSEASYKHFFQELGGYREMRKRIATFTTTGKNGVGLLVDLEQKGISCYGIAGYLLKSPGFDPSPAGEKVAVFRVKVGELFSDIQRHTYLEILSRAEQLGLDLLPHEAVFSLVLQDKITPIDGVLLAVKKGIPYLGEMTTKISIFNPSSGSVTLSGNITLSGNRSSNNEEWTTDTQFIFQLRQPKK